MASGYLPSAAAHQASRSLPGEPAGHVTGATGTAGPPADQPTTLFVLDDVQSSYPPTLRWLRELGQRQASSALWILARFTVSANADTERLFSRLDRAGAVRIELSPLGEDAAAALVADELGAVPEQGLVDLAAGVGGNPLLSIELLAGLKDESRIRLNYSKASLIPGPLTQRVLAVVRRWLLDHGRRVRQFLEVGAVMGRSFQLDTVASLLGRTPAGVLPELEAALAAGIVVPTGDMLGFRRELVWRAVVEDLPVTARQALHRQVGEFLLEHGASPAAAAAHLVSGSRLGDRQAPGKRHVTYVNRPRSGWASLTDTERAVSNLVIQGLTTRQVAAEMLLGTPTVAFHIRQVYRKLDIDPRADLARILLERSTTITDSQAAPDQEPPDREACPGGSVRCPGSMPIARIIGTADGRVTGRSEELLLHSGH